MKKILFVLCVGLVIFAGGSLAFAGPIPASLSGGLPVAGETNLASASTGASGDISVDWIVQSYAGTEGLLDASGAAITGAGFLYLYQVENSQTFNTGTGPDVFTVTLPFGTGSILGAGFLAGDDLDSATGLHGTHALGGEAGVGLTLQSTTGTGFSATTSVAGGNVSWFFEDGTGTQTELLGGHETDTLFFVSTLPPAYGIGGASDSTPPSPWSSFTPVRGQPVPVPAPEPTTLLGVGIGFAAVAGMRKLKFGTKREKLS